MKKFLEKAICIIVAIVLLWTVVSYIEIISKNTEPNPTYSKTNLIVQLVEGANKE